MALMYSFCHAQKIAVTCQKKKAKALFESMNVFEKVSQVFAYFFIKRYRISSKYSKSAMDWSVGQKELHSSSEQYKLVKRMKAKSS